MSADSNIKNVRFKKKKNEIAGLPKRYSCLQMTWVGVSCPWLAVFKYQVAPERLLRVNGGALKIKMAISNQKSLARREETNPGTPTRLQPLADVGEGFWGQEEPWCSFCV